MMYLSRVLMISLGLMLMAGCGEKAPRTQEASIADSDRADVDSADVDSADADRATDESVNVYTARHYDSDLELYKRFTRETGIKVNLIEGGGDALIERLALEGEASPADIFITADAGSLWRAQNKDLFASIQDDALEAAIPARFRHPEGKWFGLSKRARIIIYNKRDGLPDGLRDYEDLADEDYRGMVCIRPSSNIYNQSLLASLIGHWGVDAAQIWAKGVVENFARKPQGNDTSQIEAVAAGICKIGVVNSYYVARYTGASSGKNKTIGERIGVLYPNQSTRDGSVNSGENKGRGTHVNISGAGILRHAPNAANGRKLLQFLLSEEAQRAFASGNNEYPVREGVQAVGAIAKLGSFREDHTPMTVLGENQRKAVEVFDRAGWF